ncbi:MAG: hypothetical protein RL722_1474 [Pseudomonadota bacterium]|jgi:hypothetical protein
MPTEGCALHALPTLYVYYRVPARQAEAARAALQAGLDRLAAAAPGLHSRLLQRCPPPSLRPGPPPGAPPGAPPALPDDGAAELTWMEIHERPASPQAGLDHRDRQLIATLLADLPPGRIGPRHEEWFGPV